jgi:uncharacterized protein (TIGR03437 family)
LEEIHNIMPRIFCLLVSAMLIAAGAQAATTNTTLTVNVSAALSGTNISVTGTANLASIGNGTVNESLSFTSLIGATGNITLPMPVVLSGGTLNISLTLPSSLLTSGGGSISGSGSVTGGTGSYAGASGSFPTLSGTASGSILTPGSSMTMNFSGAGTVTTSGSGSGGGTSPTITAVLDAGSYTSNVAQGSIIVVKGSNLSASGYTPFGFPLPTQSTGSDKAQINFTPTAGGTGTPAYLLYTYNQSGVNQLAAILPSTVAAGNYNVTVTAGGATSAPFQVTVVAQKAELFTGDASGSGLALVQNVVSASQYDINRFTTTTVGGATVSPAKPGQYMVAYATGMGPVTGGDNVGSAGVDETSKANVQVIVGGTSIPALYVGRVAGLAGLDQINFQLPGNVATGCTVSFQISAGGKLSAPTFIAIAPSTGATACVQPGYTTQQLQDFDNGKTIYSGGFDLAQFSASFAGVSVKSGTIAGGFYATTGFQLASAPQVTVSTSNIGSCQVIQTSGTGSGSGGSAIGLDAGAVALSGPGISGNLTVTQDASTKTYSLLLGGGFGAAGNVNIGAGTYALNGAGGTDVGPFNASITIGSPLTITGGLPSAVTRSSGLTLNWTGGLSSDLVEIFGSSSTGTGANTTTTSFICLTTAGAGTFTVPSSVLTQLPAVTASASSGSGGLLAVESGPTPTIFSAPLKAGGSITNVPFSSLVGIGGLVSYQ